MTPWSDDDVLQILFRYRARRETALQIATSLAVSQSAILGVTHRVRQAGQACGVASLTCAAATSVFDAFLKGTSAAHVAKSFEKAGRPMSRHAVLALVSEILCEAALAEGAVAAAMNAQDRVAWPAWWSPLVPSVQRSLSRNRKAQA